MARGAGSCRRGTRPPGPTTRTDQSRRGTTLYRPVSISADPVPEPRGATSDDRGPQDGRRARAPRHRSTRPPARRALLRPRLLRPRGREPVVADVADGVPPRGDPRAERLRRVRDPRSVGARGPRRRRRGRRLPERLPSPGHEAGRGPGPVRERLHLPVPRLVLRHRWRQHLRPPGQDVRRAQPAARRHRPDAGAVRDLGRLRLDQPLG